MPVLIVTITMTTSICFFFQVHLQELPTSEEEGKLTNSEDDMVDNIELLYTIDENPPWYIALCLGFQVLHPL